MEDEINKGYTIVLKGRENSDDSNKPTPPKIDRSNKRTIRHVNRNLDMTNPTHLSLEFIHCGNDKWLMKEIENLLSKDNYKNKNDNVSWKQAIVDGCYGDVDLLVALIFQNKFEHFKLFGTFKEHFNWNVIAKGMKINDTMKELCVYYGKIVTQQTESTGEETNNDNNNNETTIVKNNNFEKIKIWNCSFVDQNVTSLGKSFYDCNKLTKLSMASCRLDDDQIADMVTAMVGGVPSLVELDISYNFCRSKGCAALSDFLKSDKCKLTELNLSQQMRNGRSSRGSSFSALFDGVGKNKSLTYLTLAENGLPPSDATAVACAIGSNTTIKILKIYDNSFDQTGATQIATSLSRHPTIEVADLWGRSLGKEGWMALLNALKLNPKLTYVGCQRYKGFGSRSLDDNEERLLQHYQDCNDSGRRAMYDNTVLPGLWPIILSRAWKLVDSSRDIKEAKTSVIYSLLRDCVSTMLLGVTNNNNNQHEIKNNNNHNEQQPTEKNNQENSKKRKATESPKTTPLQTKKSK